MSRTWWNTVVKQLHTYYRVLPILSWATKGKVTPDQKNKKSIYLYTLAVSPSLGGSRQHKRNNKNNRGFTPFFQQWQRKGIIVEVAVPLSKFYDSRQLINGVQSVKNHFISLAPILF